MSHYDFIITGGGVSGLSLVYHMLHSSLGACSILVVEQRPLDQDDHALSFWSVGPTLFDPVIFRSWGQIQFNSDGFSTLIDLGSYRYHTIRNTDYAAFIHDELSTCPTVDCVTGTVEGIKDGSDCARVRVNSEEHTCQWVFDSRRVSLPSGRHIALNQQFKGWQIETPLAEFNPQTVTLFDLRVTQENGLCFFYLLPYSERQALVECVQLHPGDPDGLLKGYIEDTLGIHAYRLLSTEGGVTPLTDFQYPRRVGHRVVTIGVQGGRVKPSTGYAFMRIQRDSEAIVRSLIAANHPFDIPQDPPFYRFGDETLLNMMQTYGQQVKPFYTALFKNNPIERVFHFLDEAATTRENLALMRSIPLHLLWRSLIKAASQTIK